MSSLSFVALSMQTTHLDPATVSKASYLKMVDGQITRLDSIAIISPTASVERTDHPRGAVSWPEALSQLGMVIGKLPIVSYYRDADKEIFQAASHRSDITPTTFQWLDCRALSRELLPELPDHQPSTVLAALDLYDEHADSATVEQTAQIVLQLADARQATTVSELWGDLYNQPDDLLGLDATLEGMSSPEPDRRADEAEDHHEATAPAATHFGVTPAEAPTALSEEITETPADTEPTGSDLPKPVTLPAVEPPAEPSIEHPHTDQGSAATLDTDAEEDDETGDGGDSTAQSVIESENLERPKFLEIPDAEDPGSDEPLTSANHEADPEPLLDIPIADKSTSETEPVAAVDQDAAETDQDQAASPFTSHGDQQPPNIKDETVVVAPDADLTADDGASDEDEPEEPEEVDTQNAAEPPTYGSSTDPKPYAPVYQVVTPAPGPRPGARKPSAPSALDIMDDDGPHATTVEAPRQPAARSARAWGIAGMILFGALTIVGLVLTVMATLLFFTTNNLLVETRVAGVILTGAITLLSVLMATLSYRTYRKK